VQAIAGVPRQLRFLIQRPALIQRPVSIIGTGVTVRRPIAATLTIPDDQLPVLAATWRPVPGARVTTVAQSFAAYTNDQGLEIHLHSVVGLAAATTDRLVALIGLGRHRVSVFSDGNRFEARWHVGDTMHRLAAWPPTLGAFMALLLNLTWPDSTP
jgi:hypothetical protein